MEYKYCNDDDSCGMSHQRVMFEGRIADADAVVTFYVHFSERMGSLRAGHVQPNSFDQLAQLASIRGQKPIQHVLCCDLIRYV